MKVYLALTYAVALAAAGAAFGTMSGLGGGSFLSVIVSIGLMFWLQVTPKEQTALRLGIFSAFSTFQGMTLSSLINVILDVDPSILITALLGTAVVFLSFSLAALFSKRRSYLYLSGALGSAMMWMFFASIANLWFRSPAMFSVQLYAGLAILIGYTVYDTQVIIEKASAGQMDVLGHALTLFVDAIGLFVRIAIILLRNSEKKKDDRRRRS